MQIDHVSTSLPLEEALRIASMVGSRSSGDLDVVMYVKSKRAGDIVGESEKGYADGKPRIPVLGYYLSSGARTDAGTGQTTGYRAYSDLTVLMQTNVATSSMMSSFGVNDELTIELNTFKTGGDQLKDMQSKFTLKLEDARVKTYTLLNGSALPDSGSLDIVQFHFRKITVESAPQTWTGQRGSVRTFSDNRS
jgi:hypothetical protein